MSHNHKKLARHVQRTLKADTTLEIPAYQWCLRRVIHYLPEALAAAGGYNTRLKDELVRRIRQEARLAVGESQR